MSDLDESYYGSEEAQDIAEDIGITPKDIAGSIVVGGTDWTTDTIVNQIIKQNIILNPRFQRRDAWRRSRKSAFIESLMLGFSVPQIVLAEHKTEKGKYIVIDGKQRLLTLVQFWVKVGLLLLGSPN